MTDQWKAACDSIDAVHLAWERKYKVLEAEIRRWRDEDGREDKYAWVESQNKAMANALERLWRWGYICEGDGFCNPGCPHEEAEKALRAAGRLANEVSAAEPPSDAVAPSKEK